jgi:hypothetical protein
MAEFEYNGGEAPATITGLLNRRAAASSGPWHQLHWAVRGSSGICNFHFVSIFHE